MYADDVTEWNKNKKKKYRDKKLNENPDVLFKVYNPPYPFNLDNLCGLVFRPTSDPVLWMRLIIQTYTNLSPQWSRRQVTEPVRDVINIKGSSEELLKFREKFQKHLRKIACEDLAVRMKKLEL